MGDVDSACRLKSLVAFYKVVSFVKVPLLWVMKGSYFGFVSPQQQVDMHARSKNTIIVL